MLHRIRGRCLAPGSARQFIVLPVLALLIGACVRGTAVVTADPLYEREMAIFRTALDTLLATERLAVVVDPRVLSSDPAKPDMRESSSRPPELEPQQDHNILAARRSVLADRSIGVVDVTDRHQCNLDWGLLVPGRPRPTSPIQRCIALGLSRAGGVHYPPHGIAEAAPARGARTVRAVLIGGSSWRLVDIVLAPSGSKEWRVLAIRRLVLVVS